MQPLLSLCNQVLRNNVPLQTIVRIIIKVCLVLMISVAISGCGKWQNEMQNRAKELPEQLSKPSQQELEFAEKTAEGDKGEKGQPRSTGSLFSLEHPKGYRLQEFSAVDDVVLEGLAVGKVHRLIMGIDSAPRDLSKDDVVKLGDLWATNVLAKGIFPKDVPEILAAMKAFEQSTTNKLKRFSFLVGEGGQIPASVISVDALDRTFRYVIVWKSADTSRGEVFLSIPAGTRTGVNELIAWDKNEQRFNFYRREDPDRWFWRGDSTHAFDDRSKAKGCFECHPNGSLLMKELRRPWLHWHSEEVSISSTVVPKRMRPSDVPELKELFDRRTEAQVLEQLVAGGIERTNNRRTAFHGGKLLGIEELLYQLIDSRNANLASSRTKGLTAGGDTRIVIPSVFFFDQVAFVKRLRMRIDPADTTLKWDDYKKLLEKYKFSLVSGEFRVPGDTFFLFTIPETAFEDLSLLTWMLDRNIITKRFAICLFMVDFPNPVYSPVRNGLVKYIKSLPKEINEETLTAVEENLVHQIITEGNIQGPVTEEGLDEATGEQQFSFYWKLPPGELENVSENHISRYLQSVSSNLKTTEGRDEIVRLSISRRWQFEIIAPGAIQAEFPLIFPKTNLNFQEPLRMRRDGHVEPTREIENNS